MELKNNQKRKERSRKKKPLIILCFGCFHVFTDYECSCSVNWRTSKANELFAYFIQNIKKTLPLSKIITDVWPETAPEKATNLFHTNLGYVRNFLRTVGGNRSITYVNHEYSIFLEATFCDYLSFNDCMKCTRSTLEGQVIKHRQYAINLYKGEYMEGTFYEWSNIYKEYFLNQNIQNLLYISQYYMEIKEYRVGLFYLRTLVQLNPLMENVHVMLMKALSCMGDRQAVIKQYNTLHNILMEELGLYPQPETKRIFYELIK